MNADVEERPPDDVAGCRLEWGDANVTTWIADGGARKIVPVLPAGLHALVIDDDLIVGLDIALALHEVGAQSVTLVDSVAAAREVVLAKNIGVIVLDSDLGDSAAAFDVLGQARCVLTTSGRRPALPALTPTVHKPFADEDLQRAVAALFAGPAQPFATTPGNSSSTRNISS